MKRRIRLTESDLRHIVKESVRRIMNEEFSTDVDKNQLINFCNHSDFLIYVFSPLKSRMIFNSVSTNQDMRNDIVNDIKYSDIEVVDTNDNIYQQFIEDAERYDISRNFELIKIDSGSEEYYIVYEKW